MTSERTRPWRCGPCAKPCSCVVELGRCSPPCRRTAVPGRTLVPGLWPRPADRNLGSRRRAPHTFKALHDSRVWPRPRALRYSWGSMKLFSPATSALWVAPPGAWCSEGLRCLLVSRALLYVCHELGLRATPRGLGYPGSLRHSVLPLRVSKRHVHVKGVER